MLMAAIIFFIILTGLAILLGKYVAYVYRDKANSLINNLKIPLFNIEPQTWDQYFRSLMCFNIICIVVTFIIIYFQEYLPLNSNLQEGLGLAASLNAAVSFTSGTFWQSHNPETQLSMFSQLFALTLQNFLSGGTGIAVFIAFTRGIINNNNPLLGNFYEDFFKSIFLILLPISLVISLFLVSQSVPFDFVGQLNYTDLTGNQQQLFIGPVAGQVAIKNLVANGGSLFASASAHPFEAPNRVVVIFSLFLVLWLPVALIFTYGYLLKEPKLSWSLYAVVLFIMGISLWLINLGENEYGVPLVLSNESLQDTFNYTGKELIYDKFPSLMWILSITTSSSGSANACLENYSPLSTLVMFASLVLSKFVLEGVGSGFFAMLAYLVVAIFLRGLITGNTANFFGKKISIREINYVVVVFLLVPVGILFFTGITLLLPISKALITYPASQAVTDITYNFASTFTNNGSVLTGINITNDYFNYTTTIAMLIGRYPVIYYSLALSGSFANKKKIVNLRQEESQFGGELSIFLIIIVLLVGAIAFLPLVILGPFLEFIRM
ncbi:KdpA-like potassium-transporting ATPase A chainprotein [Candidatus Trichorickettsia mobilis]|uniref:KdpA-like potassium-transporting ATPase A chainprotein n=2 Tax=Candidatus Trichorickettsia mobilis TaxID=1346319 RepID=A0ABZ0UT92_9RICK|nr:KdpA-like potassium-transporting ATPase A chainprotein [Candidatus Trichorickettsia mobilis]